MAENVGGFHRGPKFHPEISGVEKNPTYNWWRWPPCRFPAIQNTHETQEKAKGGH